MKPAAALTVLALVLAGCGDNDVAPRWNVELPPGDIVERLATVPGAIVEPFPTSWNGYLYFKIRFTQPVSHDDPSGPTFEQHLSFIYRDAAAPTVLFSTGYEDWWDDYPSELTQLLGANQLVVEHRYFGESRPASPDWSKLTIAEAAADHHRVVQAFRPVISTGAWISTGGSKGGMTSVYHRRFYADDVDGTVAYVAPISFGPNDPRYQPYFEALGPPVCHQAISDLQVEILTNRRQAMVDRAQLEADTTAEITYSRVAVGPAVESAVRGLQWEFWQTGGVDWCDDVPPITASDGTIWEFLDSVSPPSTNSDYWVGVFEAYYYQARAQLGSPGTTQPHLDGLMLYTGDEYAGILPVDAAVPEHDARAMDEIDAWVRGLGHRLLFLYGEWDPWSGGMFELGDATDSMRVIQAEGSHSSDIHGVAEADREQVLAHLTSWTGVDLSLSTARARPSAPPPRMPHIPSAVVRQLELESLARQGGAPVQE